MYATMEMFDPTFAAITAFVTKPVIVKLIGNAGCGKTEIILATIEQLTGSMGVGVVLANEPTDDELRRVQRICPTTATSLRELKGDPELVLIEAKPSDADPHDGALRVGIFSVAAGDNKAARHPEQLSAADLLLLTKIDLLAHVPFDLEKFRTDATGQSAARMIEFSPRSGQGLEPWLQWLRHLVERRREENAGAPSLPECFLG